MQPHRRARHGQLVRLPKPLEKQRFETEFRHIVLLVNASYNLADCVQGPQSTIGSAVSAPNEDGTRRPRDDLEMGGDVSAYLVTGLQQLGGRPKLSAAWVGVAQPCVKESLGDEG